MDGVGVGRSLRITVSHTGECVMSMSCPGEGSAACQLLDPVWTTLRLMGNILYPSMSLRPGALCLPHQACLILYLTPSQSQGRQRLCVLLAPGTDFSNPRSPYSQGITSLSTLIPIRPLSFSPGQATSISLLPGGWQIVADWFNIILVLNFIPLSPSLPAFCCEITGCLKKGGQKERRHTPPKSPNWTIIWKKYFSPHVAY